MSYIITDEQIKQIAERIAWDEHHAYGQHEVDNAAREYEYNIREILKAPQWCTREQPHEGPCNGLPCESVKKKLRNVL